MYQKYIVCLPAYGTDMFISLSNSLSLKNLRFSQ